MPKRTDVDYSELLRFRTALRRFERWSEAQARTAGITPAQHQLLLAVRGHGDPAGPTIGDIAEYLMLRPHSAVELVDRAARAGLVRRHSDSLDARVSRVRPTPRGDRVLKQLTRSHLEELRWLAQMLRPVVTEPGV